MVTTSEFAALAAHHTLGDDDVPKVVTRIADGRPATLVWRNELGGLTFEIGDHHVKWNPRSTGVDLDRERIRLEWLAGRHPVPTVIAHGGDEEAQWLVTETLPGSLAVGDAWRRRSSEAIAAIAAGLRTMHAIPVDDLPTWADDSWVCRQPPNLGPRPTLDDPVWVHGDGCAPNTLVMDDGTWSGHVDFGDLAVGDRWADLAIASMSLDWNFGDGRQGEFFEAYGIEPDLERIEWYRALWHQES